MTKCSMGNSLSLRVGLKRMPSFVHAVSLSATQNTKIRKNGEDSDLPEIWLCGTRLGHTWNVSGNIDPDATDWDTADFVQNVHPTCLYIKHS